MKIYGFFVFLKTMKRVLLQISCVLLSFILSYDSYSQVIKPSEVFFTKDTLRNDLKDLKQTIYESHQNPFTYVDSLELEKLFWEAHNSIDDDMTLSNFAEIVSQFLINLKDSHTGVDYGYLFSFLNHKKSLNLYFRTTLIGDSIVITKDYQEILPPGAIILSINAISQDKLLEDIQAYEFQEGNSEYSRDFILGSIFPRVYALKYPVKEENKIEYIYDGRIFIKEYPGISFKEIRKDRKKRKTKTFDLEIVGESAVLKVGSFSKESNKAYSKFLEKSFKRIKRKNIKRLAIDLRGNLGGSTWRMEELFTYLDGPDMTIPHNMIMTKSELSARKYDYLMKGFRGWVRTNFFKKDDKMRVFREIANLPVGETDTVYYKTPPRKNKNAFKGENVLFIDHSSASASVIFASGFRQFNYGKIYGTPCLGGLTGTWGDATPYRLKNSGLWVNISVIRLNATADFSTDPNPIIPEVFYEPTLEDVMESEDKLKQFFFYPNEVKLNLLN